MSATASPMAAITRPARVPTMSASTITLDSRARTMARRRRGTSSGRLNQCMEKIQVRRVRPSLGDTGFPKCPPNWRDYWAFSERGGRPDPPWSKLPAELCGAAARDHQTPAKLSASRDERLRDKHHCDGNCKSYGGFSDLPAR